MNSIKQFLIRTAEGYLAKNDPEKHNPFKTAITGNMTSSHKYAARDAPTPQQQNYQVAEILERISQDKVATVQELKEAMSSGQARLQNQNLRISDEIVSLDDLEAIYKRFGIIFKAVNTRVKKIWKVTPRVEPAIPDDAQAEADAKECEDFLVSSRLNKGKKPKLLTTNSVIFGNGWLEIIYDPVTGKPIDTEAIHPATMDFRRKGDGSIELVDDADSVYAGLPVAYQQKVGQATKDFYREGWGKETDGEWKQILQLTFYSVGDEFLGISMLEPMYKTAEQYMKILEGRGEAAYRSAWQRTFIDYGVEGNVNSCTPEAKKQAEEVAKDLVQGDIIVKPWFLKVDAIQPDLSNFDKLDDGYVNILAATSGLPKFNLMGVSKETSFATSKSQRADFADEIKSDQESIAECLNYNYLQESWTLT